MLETYSARAIKEIKKGEQIYLKYNVSNNYGLMLALDFYDPDMPSLYPVKLYILLNGDDPLLT